MCFDTYRAQVDKAPTDAFLAWLVGFWEGDSHISFSTRNGKPSAFVGLTQNDPRLLYWVQSQLGFGHVYPHGGASWRYSVEDRAGLQCMLWLLYNNLVLVHRRVQWMALFQLLHPSETPPELREPQLTLTDGWLAGFTEAKGGFEGNWTRGFRLGPGKYGIRLQYRLTQKTGERETLESVAALSGPKQASIYVDKRQRDGKTFFCDRLAISTGAAQGRLVEYLTTFPLQGQKRFDFNVFRLLRERQRTRGSAIRTAELASRTARWLKAYVTLRKAREAVVPTQKKKPRVSSALQVFRQTPSVWQHQETTIVLSANLTVPEIVQRLRSAVPGSIPDRFSGLYLVCRGLQRSAYGWTATSISKSPSISC